MDYHWNDCCTHYWRWTFSCLFCFVLCRLFMGPLCPILIWTCVLTRLCKPYISRVLNFKIKDDNLCLIFAFDGFAIILLYKPIMAVKIYLSIIKQLFKSTAYCAWGAVFHNTPPLSPGLMLLLLPAPWCSVNLSGGSRDVLSKDGYVIKAL